MNGNARCVAVGLCAAMAVGCLKITLPESIRIGGGAESVTRVDSNSLPSVMNKLHRTNREIGQELGDRDWKAVSKEGAKLADWANRAARLKAQSTSPDTFAAHCASLATHGTAVHQAALSHNVTRASSSYSEATRLLGLMDQLVK
jgi:hypothetical protein